MADPSACIAIGGEEGLLYMATICGGAGSSWGDCVEAATISCFSPNLIVSGQHDLLE